jgi:tetratricopeptide (TPR) repeat protein
MLHGLTEAALFARRRRHTGLAIGAASLAVGLSVAPGIVSSVRTRDAAPVPRSPIAETAGARSGAGNLVDRWVTEGEQAAARNPRDPQAFRRLAVALMRKERQCGDPSYRDRAMQAIERSLKLEPDSYESLKLKAWVLASGHHFGEARELARRCIALRPHDRWNYGVLADAQVELGDYAGAVESVQKMIDRKPDLASYSRAAHLRYLHGDGEGALQLYDLALDTTDPRDPESVAWVRVQRGNVRLSMGAARAADKEYQQALKVEPGYHLALAGRARCQAVLGNRREAIRLYERALAATPRPDWAIALGDLKRAAGDPARAEAQYAVARAASRAGREHAHLDRKVTLILADHGDRKAALHHARHAAEESDDIYTWDALAWALFKNERYEEAWKASQKARRLGTRDAEILRHAALIAARVPGASQQAKQLLRQARAIDPGVTELAIGA